MTSPSAMNDTSTDNGSGMVCVNIDLDDLRYYRAIHGLPEGEDTPVVFETAVPRFLDLCESLSIRTTLFVIGMDTRWDAARNVLREAVSRGHEIGSHSQSHFYDVSRRTIAEMTTEIRSARDRIGDVVGGEVPGFRAPGYNLSDGLLAVLNEAGHRYDSSVLPAPAYYLARAAVILGMRFRGRRSASITGRFSDCFRSTTPFSWNRQGGLKEFPITACGIGRLPLIGTTLARGGWTARLPLEGATRLPFVNVEFHALDFLDLNRDPIEAELAVEPTLGIPLELRLERFENALRSLLHDRVNRTLGEL